MPDVPTIGQAGYPDVLVSLWSGIFVPRRTPEPISAQTRRRNSSHHAASRREAEIHSRVTDIIGGTSQEFVALIERERTCGAGSPGCKP